MEMKVTNQIPVQQPGVKKNSLQAEDAAYFVDVLKKQMAADGAQTTAASPAYQLSQQQIDELKKTYDISDLSSGDFSSLLSELADMGVLSESDTHFGVTTTQGGLEMIRRPIVVGLFPADRAKQLFSYPAFEQGDLLDYMKTMLEQNESAIQWLADSRENKNDHAATLQNINSIRSYQEDFSRVYRVLQQLL